MIPFLVVALLFLAAVGYMIYSKSKAPKPAAQIKEDTKELTPEEKQ